MAKKASNSSLLRKLVDETYSFVGEGENDSSLEDHFDQKDNVYRYSSSDYILFNFLNKNAIFFSPLQISNDKTFFRGLLPSGQFIDVPTNWWIFKDLYQTYEKGSVKVRSFFPDEHDFVQVLSSELGHAIGMTFLGFDRHAYILIFKPEQMSLEIKDWISNYVETHRFQKSF